MNEIIYCGLHIITECSYLYIKESNKLSYNEDKKLSTLTITFTKDCTSTLISKVLGVKLDTPDIVIEGMSRPIRIPNTILSINGLKFKKLTYESHTIRLVLVDDHPSRVAQDYSYTTLVINTSDKDNPEFKSYVFNNLRYLKLLDKIDFSDYKLYNFPKILIYNKSLDLSSDNSYVNKLRGSYDRYLIKAIDYEDQFFKNIGKILSEYGVELARINREKTLKSTSYVSYSINQTPSNYLHPGGFDSTESILSHKVAIDFQLRTPNLVLYLDFKNRYNNVDLLTNFTEFKTKDKYGNEWTAAVRWGSLTDNYNQNYSSDDNSNFSNQCDFRCELYFYEVYDKTYDFITDIKFELVHTGLYDEA